MTAPSSPAPLATDKPRFDLLAFARKHRTILFLLLLVAVFGAANERFLTARNALNILSEVSIYGIIAVGMTFVILIGGIDVAVGSLLAFASIAAAYVVTAVVGDGPATWLIALLVSTLIGLAGGYVQGKAVTWLHVPAFIVTLGGMTVWRGATLLLNDGGPISGFNDAYRWWGSGEILFLPVPVVIFALVAAAGHVALRYTRYGRQVYAVGGNAEAARLSGVNVDFITTSVYAIIGALAGLSGFLLSARLGSAEAVAGTGYELRVIASVVIGGASLTGGSGGVGGTVLGALLIGVLSNGLVMLHVTSYVQQVVIGLIIVAAVAFDHYARTHKA
ncbi:ABC transporter permease [Caulobacter vibrioides]|uniref:Sugar ABC transporter, permease protein n=2 Tax=Caulobacter vibrioides TaxID=155892 RepID=Q9A9V0_CAUVC|nr:ABC transporter permease [Caulobacter vibrioides]YP_002516277.1 inositol ABC transport system, permease protein IatP [Caulobacter vibrioides NA1000]AAK22846.1 sugar ABC transporter, permease protein [Caulobacter vibrioides CB15]ACL94369.1 inositol ABC transport system, permease protein IatP [Caulobacter vibrioides NA1000]ATC27701.1 ABC transporter permease [Caulobacter vibrioides]QXZ52942.1 ABC transporter permease [Caulobacter vibrioides]